MHVRVFTSIEAATAHNVHISQGNNRLRPKLEHVQAAEATLLEQHQTDWQRPLDESEITMLDVLDDFGYPQDSMMGCEKARITTKCLYYAICAASIPVIDEEDWKRRSKMTFKDIPVAYAINHAYSRDYVMCCKRLSDANPATPYTQAVHRAIDKLNRAIELNQYGPGYHDLGFAGGMKRYEAASRLLRQELVRETGLLYLAVPAKHYGQKPSLVAITAQL